FQGGPEPVPTFSVADLFACAKKGDTAFFEKHFSGKTVLLGTVLDVEDRKLTSKRFATGVEADRYQPRCQLPVMKGITKSGQLRDTIPGVYIHAAAVNNILRGDALQRPVKLAEYSVTFMLALATGVLALVFSPSLAGLVFGGGVIVWFGFATTIFAEGYVLPLYDPVAAGGLAFAALFGYRISIADKDKRYLRKIFSLYMPPAVVDRMVESERLPKLGGEAREVSIFFSDIVAFTTLSEKLSPEDVVRFLNEYLTEMSNIIEDHNGYIEKYIADAITGVFGAPMDDSDHAINAVLAAMESQKRLTEIQERFQLPDGDVLRARIGVNSGDMLVGNIGSRRRFSYSAMGDAANLGARLEGANKFYATEILVGERTRELCGAHFTFREVDKIRVVGRTTPVTIYQPLGLAGEIDGETQQLLSKFETYLDYYYNRNFTEAALGFEGLAEIDPVSKVFAERARAYAETPPPADWDGVNTLGSK
ncbi:MAG: CHASE2 domain-containing protein, partial [Rhodospirillales bacterium]|nr:CHASE2 domain-containing protein [Rhodospirillales bacterium]